MILRSRRPGHRPPDRVVSWSIQILAKFLLIFWISGLPWTGVAAERGGCPVGCTCLESEVSCRKKGLTELPDDLPVWTEELDLQRNNITNISAESLRKIPRLRILNLSHNKLKFLPEVNIDWPANLTELRLSHNRISKITDTTLRGLDSLQFLDLQRNSITSIPAESLQGSSQLRKLNLSYNKLAFSPGERIMWPGNLTELRLSHNKISQITDTTLRGLKSLTFLDLSYNSINHVQSLCLKDLGSVEKLNLQNNKLGYLPAGALHGLGRMTNLSLQNNQLVQVRKDWIFHMHKLLTINFADNQISYVMDGVWGKEGASNIESIDLSGNNLTEISERTFHSDSGSILKINISRNGINMLDDMAFKKLDKLQVLDVSNNIIGGVFDSTTAPFSNLKSLKKLFLVDVDAVIISNRSFVELPKLNHLDLSGNEIRVIEPSTFNRINSTKLRSIRMNTTSFVCDCQVEPFLADIQHQTFKKSRIKCGFPPELRKKSLKRVTKQQLKCFPNMVPAIIQDPESTVAVVGSNITLACVVSFSAEFVSSVQWLKNGQPMFETNMTGLGGYGTSTLRLNNVARDEEGEYSCVAQNTFKRVYSRKAQVTTVEYPQFTLLPPSVVTVRRGDSAKFECAATGSPQPDISWQKDGGTEFTAAMEQRLEFQIDNNWVKILRVIPEDAGVYSCIAQNSAGSTIVNVTLQVRNLTENTPKRDVSTRPQTKVKHVGDSVDFECLKANNWTRVQWLKNESMVIETMRPDEQVQRLVLEDGRLRINNLSENDAGVYQCVSALTEERGSVFTLQVSKKPVVKQFDWWGMDNQTFWIAVSVFCTLFVALSITLIGLGVIYCGRKRSGSGGSSTQSDETALPDECNPINGSHPSVDSNLNSPMTEYTEYTPVASEYSVGDGRFSIANNGGTFGTPGSQARCKSYGESLAESQSFGNYLTLKPTPNIHSSYSALPQRSCLTMPRVTRI